MAFDVDRLLRLWSEPLPDDAAAAAAFRELYADPVTVNGAPVPAAGLVVRARALQAALDRVQREVVSVVEAGDQVAVAFRLRGRHSGTLMTSAGPVPATGGVVELRVVDVLTLTDGRISDVWMVADELGALAGTGAVRLAPAGR